MPALRLHRFLDLVAFLAGRRVPVPVEAIMEGVPSYAERWMAADEKRRKSVRRMFERDKEDLRELGIPIEVRDGPAPGSSDGMGYRIAGRDFYLPYLRLLEDAAGARISTGAGRAGTSSTFEIEADEAGAAIEGLLHLSDLPDFPLAAEARSAYRKLTFDLDPARFRAAPVVVLPSGGAPVGEAIKVLTDALFRRRRIAFDYHGMRSGERTRREIEPYGLLLKRGQWYLVGHDALRDAVRVFRLSRMSEWAVASGGKGSEFEVPEDFDLGAFAEREPWELAWKDDRPVGVRARFGAARARWAERNGYGEAVEERSGGDTVRAFEVLDPSPFVGWILGLDGEAEVESPAALRSGVREAAERIIRLHEEAR